MPQLSGRDYPLSATPSPSPVSSTSAEQNSGILKGIFGTKEERQDRRYERQTNRAVRQSNRGARCGRRGCAGQGSGFGWGGY